MSDPIKCPFCDIQMAWGWTGDAERPLVESIRIYQCRRCGIEGPKPLFDNPIWKKVAVWKADAERMDKIDEHITEMDSEEGHGYAVEDVGQWRPVIDDWIARDKGVASNES